MRDWKIILAQFVLLTGYQFSSAQQIAPSAPTAAMPYPGTAAPQPMIVSGQPYWQPGPMMVTPAPQMAPVYGQPGMVMPMAPGAAGPATFSPPGAAMSPPMAVPPDGIPIAPNPDALALGPNPISIPAVDEQIAWDQIVDVVSEYFTVAREQQARRSGEVWTEGIIETAPEDGATWLEPHKHDSVGSFNRWEATFQTIRRRAHIRVMPDATGYLVEVIVEKELEDLPNPEKATAGSATFFADTSLPSRRLEQVSRTRMSPHWIQLGRDPPLEQRMLGEIQARFGGMAAGPASNFPR